MRRKARRGWLFAAAALVLFAAITACGEDEPAPGAAEAYDVAIAICNDRLESTEDFCDRIDASTADFAYANVLFGKASGHTVSIRSETVEGGDAVDVSPPEEVPNDRSWLHVVQIPRSDACDEATCKVAVHALVDGSEVAREDFTFAAR